MSPRRYRLGRRQAAVERTRARILAAAQALLVSPRTSALSIDAIARRAGVTRATVYQRFGSRRKLVETLFDDLARRGGMRDLAQAFRDSDPERGLERFVATFGRFWTAYRALHRRLRALGAMDAGLGRTLAAREEWRREGLAVLIGRLGERARRVPPSDSGAVRDVRDALFVLTSFPTFDGLAGPGRTPADVVPLVHRLARLVLGLEDVD